MIRPRRRIGSNRAPVKRLLPLGSAVLACLAVASGPCLRLPRLPRLVCPPCGRPARGDLVASRAVGGRGAGLASLSRLWPAGAGLGTTPIRGASRPLVPDSVYPKQAAALLEHACNRGRDHHRRHRGCGLPLAVSTWRDCPPPTHVLRVLPVRRGRPKLRVAAFAPVSPYGRASPPAQQRRALHRSQCPSRAHVGLYRSSVGLGDGPAAGRSPPRAAGAQSWPDSTVRASGALLRRFACRARSAAHAAG